MYSWTVAQQILSISSSTSFRHAWLVESTAKTEIQAQTSKLEEPDLVKLLDRDSSAQTSITLARPKSWRCRPSMFRASFVKFSIFLANMLMKTTTRSGREGGIGGAKENTARNPAAAAVLSSKRLAFAKHVLLCWSCPL